MIGIGINRMKIASTRKRRTRSRILSGGVAAVVLSLAACTGQGTTVVGSPYFSSYAPSMVGYAGARGGMLVETLGNPFQATDRQVTETVADHMQGANAGPDIRFVAEKPEGQSPTYRMRVALNADLSAERLCDETVDLTGTVAKPASPQRIDAVMAFCSGSRRISSVRGHVGSVTGVDDQGFRSLLRIMTREVLPPVDPNRIGNGDNDGDFE